MPSSYTHQILAETVYESLPENVRERLVFLPEYYLGAQGGDVFYFYNMTGGAKNFGKYFHRKNIYGVFSSFLESARSGDAHVLSYIAGYVTHYAADTVFHPYVYWLCAKEKERSGRKKENFHARIESDLDTYFVNQFKRESVSEYEYPLRYGDLEFPSVCKMLSAASEAGGNPPVTEKLFRRSVKRFIRFQNFFKGVHEGRRKALYGAEKLLRLPHTLSGLFRRESWEERYLNAERREWYYPSDPEKTSRESADELFFRAQREAVRLISLFFIALDGGGKLPEEDFSSHFLTGIPGGEEKSAVLSAAPAKQ